MPGPRSHIYLFLVPRKAQDTVINIITCLLPSRQMASHPPHLGSGPVLRVVLSAMDSVSSWPPSHCTWLRTRHLQEDQRGQAQGQEGL